MKRVVVFILIYGVSAFASAQSSGMKGMEMKDMPMKNFEFVQRAPTTW